MHTSVLHSETLLLMITLGFPWLSIHDPVISWKTGELMAWSLSVPGHSTHVENHQTQMDNYYITITMPLTSLAEVFSKAKACK